MEQFDEQIEQYKKELMRYAKENGTVYASDGGFETANETENEPSAVQTEPPEITVSEEKELWKQYKKNRPMPPEYEGEDRPEPIERSMLNEQPNNELTPGSETSYKSFENFVEENPAKGMLRVQVFAAQQAFPIINAKVEVEKELEDGAHLFSEAYTDINGIVENITLPTKEKSLSQSPGGTIPYTTYTVRVTHPHFAPLTFCQVPIFDAIESLQPVAMTPAVSINRPNV